MNVIVEKSVIKIKLQTLIIVLINFHFQSSFFYLKKSIFCSWTLYWKLCFRAYFRLFI